MIAFDVIGTPAPQGSKRHVGRGVMIESSAKVKPWRESVKWAAVEARRGGAPLTGPLLLLLEFRLPRPKSAPKSRKHPDKKPDIDKLIRSTMDALTESGIWLDDAQVVRVVADKFFAGHGCAAELGCKVSVGYV
jgi:crossover junction endodeoxyribonuclease RusA